MVYNCEKPLKLSSCIVHTPPLGYYWSLYAAGWSKRGSIRWRPLIISWSVQSNERTAAPIDLLVPSMPGGRGDGGGQMTSHMEEPWRNAAHVGKILISVTDCSCMKVGIIDNLAAVQKFYIPTQKMSLVFVFEMFFRGYPSFYGCLMWESSQKPSSGTKTTYAFGHSFFNLKPVKQQSAGYYENLIEIFCQYKMVKLGCGGLLSPLEHSLQT